MNHRGSSIISRKRRATKDHKNSGMLAPSMHRPLAAYLELARRYNGSNNGTLHLSARELARAWNWSRASAARAIEELVEKGFVEITRASGFNLKDHKRQATDTD